MSLPFVLDCITWIIIIWIIVLLQHYYVILLFHLNCSSMSWSIPVAVCNFYIFIYKRTSENIFVTSFKNIKYTQSTRQKIRHSMVLRNTFRCYRTKTRIPVCPLDKHLSNFACPGHFFMSWQMTCLGLCPTGKWEWKITRAKGKSICPRWPDENFLHPAVQYM